MQAKSPAAVNAVTELTPGLVSGPERVSGSLCLPFVPSQITTMRPQYLCVHLLAPGAAGKASPASAHQPATLLVPVRRHVERALLSPNPIIYTQNTQEHNNPLTARMSTLSPSGGLLLTYRGYMKST